MRLLNLYGTSAIPITDHRKHDDSEDGSQRSCKPHILLLTGIPG